MDCTPLTIPIRHQLTKLMAHQRVQLGNSTASAVHPPLAIRPSRLKMGPCPSAGRFLPQISVEWQFLVAITLKSTIFLCWILVHHFPLYNPTKHVILTGAHRSCSHETKTLNFLIFGRINSSDKVFLPQVLSANYEQGLASIHFYHNNHKVGGSENAAFVLVLFPPQSKAAVMR